jgi:hypothetical protein
LGKKRTVKLNKEAEEFSPDTPSVREAELEARVELLTWVLQDLITDSKNLIEESKQYTRHLAVNLLLKPQLKALENSSNIASEEVSKIVSDDGWEKQNINGCEVWTKDLPPCHGTAEKKKNFKKGIKALVEELKDIPTKKKTWREGIVEVPTTVTKDKEESTLTEDWLAASIKNAQEALDSLPDEKKEELKNDYAFRQAIKGINENED